jgi:uncharacterized membrane protein
MRPAESQRIFSRVAVPNEGDMMDTDTPAPIADAPLQVAEDARDGRRSRLLLGVAFIGAGMNHFVMPGTYEQIVPPSMKGRARSLVAVSGVAEVAGGLGVLLPWTRRVAGLGLVALLAAVFPANIHMARAPESFRKIPRWALYARLPLQPLMMWWAWRATRG